MSKLILNLFTSAVLAVPFHTTMAGDTEPGSASENACAITVEIEGFKGDSCKLLAVYADQNYLIIPEIAADGEKILITREEPFPAGFYYVMSSDNSYFQLLLDKDQRFSLQTKVGDLVGSMHVTGSLDNELFYQNLKFEDDYKVKFEAVQAEIDRATSEGANTQPLKIKRAELIRERESHIAEFATKYPDSLFTKFKLAGQNPALEYPMLPSGEIDTDKQLELYRNKFWDNVDFSESWILHTPVFYNKLKRFMKELTPQRVEPIIESADFIMQKVIKNKELFKFVVNYIGLEYRKSTVMGWEGILVHMVDTYFKDDLVEWLDGEELEKIRREIDRYRPSLLGNVGQDIRGLNPDNEYESIYEITSPIIVVYIYNIDCDHCLEETPLLKAVYDKWKDKGVDVFAFSTNQDIERWQEYVQKENLMWHNVIDPAYESRYHSKYYIDITPEIYVLNADREIIAMNLKSWQLDDIFEKELATGK